jgi:hypothetical protein
VLKLDAEIGAQAHESLGLCNILMPVAR